MNLNTYDRTGREGMTTRLIQHYKRDESTRPPPPCSNSTLARIWHPDLRVASRRVSSVWSRSAHATWRIDLDRLHISTRGEESCYIGSRLPVKAMQS